MVLEDFTTYTEVDVPDDHVTVSEHHIDFVSWKDADVYVYKDKGASHFTDFEHKVDTQAIFAEDWADGFFWVLTNEIDDWEYFRLNNIPSIGAQWYYSPDDGNYYIRLRDTFLGVPGGGYDQSIPLSPSTWYYLTINRIGTTATLEIYLTPARTGIPVDTLTMMCTDTPYRYVFAAMSRNLGPPPYLRYIEMEIENLNLQEIPNCMNPYGGEGEQICGDETYGQDPTHLYECQCSTEELACHWVDLGYSPDCDVAEPCINPIGVHGQIDDCGAGIGTNQPDTTHKYQCNDGIWNDRGENCPYCPDCQVPPQDCINPIGVHGQTDECGVGYGGQPDTTHMYQCNDGTWNDQWENCPSCPDCAVPPPPPEIPVWVWPLLFGGIILGAAIIYKSVKKK